MHANNQSAFINKVDDIIRKNNLSPEKISEAAKALLSQEDAPMLNEFTELSGGDKTTAEADKEAYLLRRNIILEALGKGQVIKKDTDLDGTEAVKTLFKTQLTSSQGSLADKLSLRLSLLLNFMIKRSHFLHGHKQDAGYKTDTLFDEINTQRVGITANTSILSSPGEDIVELDENGKAKRDSEGNLITRKAHRSIAEIADGRSEYGIYGHDDPLAEILGIKGLGSAVVHKPGEKLFIHEKASQFAALFEQMDILEGFEAIIRDSGSRVMEFKSMPAYLDEHQDPRLENYSKLVSLTEDLITKGVEGKDFALAVKNSGIALTPNLEKVLKLVEDPNEIEIDSKMFFAALRKAKIYCLVPHVIQPNNIMNEEVRFKLLSLIINRSRAEDVKQLAQEKFGYPADQDLVSINGFDIADIDFSNGNPKSFSTGQEFADMEELKAHLANSPKAPNAIMKVLSNPNQPYFEFTANTSKSDAYTDLEGIYKSNVFLIGAGDSKGSDVPLQATALLADGAAYITKGQIVNDDIANQAIDYLSTEKYNFHPFSLEQVSSEKDKETYRFKKPSEASEKFAEKNASIEDRVYTKKELTKIFEDFFKDKISKLRTVTHNNVATASIYLELFKALGVKDGLTDIAGLKEGQDFSLEADENASWVQRFLNTRYKASSETPVVPGLNERMGQEVADKGGYEKTFEEHGRLARFIKKVPLVGDLISLENPGNAFKTMFGVLSAGLVGGGVIGGASQVLGSNTGVNLGKIINKASYMVNTLIAGISFYKMTPDKFALKPLGEFMGFLSTMFPKGSFTEQVLRPLSEINLAGLGEQEAMGSNTDIDSYHGEESKAAAKEAFANKPEYQEIRNVTSKLTEKRGKSRLYWLHDFMGGILSRNGALGDLAAGIVPGVKTWMSLTKQFFTTPALMKGVFSLKTLNPLHLEADGIGVRMGKNSGAEYTLPHSQSHVMAATAFSTAALAGASVVAKKALGMEKAGEWLARLANFVPGIGLMNRAKALAKNVSGAPLKFTDLKGNQSSFSPEKAAKWQVAGAAVMSLGGIGRGLNPIFGFLQNIGLGLLLKGMGSEFWPMLDDMEAAKMIKQGKLFSDHHLNQGITKNKMQQLAQAMG